MVNAIQVLNVALTITSFVGLGLSIYAYVVETAAEADPSHRAYCDINELLSCSKVFRTGYARGFGIVGKFLGEDSFFNKPNSLIGMPFYCILIILAQNNNKLVTFFTVMLNAASALMAIYLGWLLVFVVRALCVVCIGIYLVNFVNLACSYSKLKRLGPAAAAAERQSSAKSKKKKA